MRPIFFGMKKKKTFTLRNTEHCFSLRYNGCYFKGTTVYRRERDSVKLTRRKGKVEVAHPREKDIWGSSCT